MRLGSIYVPPEGPKKCSIAFVGEAPGVEEELSGQPFVGTAGRILNRKLHRAGILRHECYITNILKYSIPDNDFSLLWSGKNPRPELSQARNELLKELEEVEANIYVCLGKNPLWALTGKTNITSWRGSILSCILPSGREIKVIGTYHPSFVNRVWTMGAVMEFDFLKVKKQSAFPEILLPQRELKLAPTMSDTLTYLSRDQDFSFDIETAPGQIRCIALAYTPQDAMCIPLVKSYWGSDYNIKKVYEALYHKMKSPRLKIGQNMSMVDFQYLIRLAGILPSKPWFDTIIAQAACYPDLAAQQRDDEGKKKGVSIRGKGLAFLASIYTLEPFWKDESMYESTDEALWLGCAKDAAVTLECKYELEKEMLDSNVRHTYEYMMELLEPLVFMMLRGLKVNPDRIKYYQRTLSESLGEREAVFSSAFGDINPHSPKQVAALATKLGLAPVYTKEGKITTGRKAIERWSKQSSELQEVAEIRGDRKELSTYANVPLDMVDGRLRYSINSVNTRTGRLSSDRSVFYCGNNLQNWPKNIRDIVIPECGKVFTECDLKGAEAMVVAYLTRDPLLIKLFEEGKVTYNGKDYTNIHCFTAGQVWGLGEDEIKEEKRKREKEEGTDTKSYYYLGKKTRHSGNYRASWKSFSEELKIPAAQAKVILQRFYDSSPNLTLWHREIEAKLKKDGTLVTPAGRKKEFFGRFGPDLIREAVAYIPQETVAYVINTGITRFYNEVCVDEDIEINLQVHDAALIQHRPDQAEYVHAKIRELFRVDLVINGRKFFIPIEIKMGPNWGNLKEVK